MQTMPLIGLGTWKLNGTECQKTLLEAYEMGYRHIDTADGYQNHSDVGKALKGLPRETVFLTTKIKQDDLAPHDIQKAIPRFLKELQVDYIDLLLIHWPRADLDMRKSLEAMQSFPEIKAVGVSNFSSEQLQDLAGFDLLTNQVEMHPYLQQKKLSETCKKLNISLTAYRPLAKGAFESDETLKAIGNKYGKSASQVALKWLVQQGVAAIPKASSLAHLKANLSIFDFTLSKEDLDKISTLDQGLRFCKPEGVTVFED